MDIGQVFVNGIAQVFTKDSMVAMLLGVILGNVIGIIPGLGGNFALAVLLPFIYGMGAVQAIAFLLGAHAVVNTGGSITAILLNTPGTPGCTPTTLDGYPLARKGKAGFAIGAALSASALGGIIGAVVLLLLIPAVRPFVLAFAPPEIFMLILTGLSFIAVLGEGSTLRALIAGLLGIFLAMIGNDPLTGFSRYGFGSWYLYDGIELVPVTLGLFAVAEMVELSLGGQQIAQTTVRTSWRELFEGTKAVVRYWWLVLRCSIIGWVIGFIPGLGSEVSAFIAYGHAKQTSKKPKEFGQGNIEGVIGPEAANNAKEGGALLPTLAFGVPGSSGMAILLGAFLIIGITPGPEMLGAKADVAFSMVVSMALANVLGALMCFPVISPLVRLTTIRTGILVPIVLVLCILGAYGVRENMGDIILLVVFGLVGFAMKKGAYPRAPMLIGLVLGHAAEMNLHLSFELFGPAFFIRPISLTILVVLIMGLLAPVISKKQARGRGAL